jgi:transposase
MSQVVRIKELQAEGLGPSAIARRLGLDRKTVAKYLAQDDFSPPPPVVRPDKPSLLDPYKSVIQQWLDGDRPVFHKQRHTAQRIYERLQAEYPAFQGSYSTVQRYVKSLRTSAPSTGTLELVWHPGECQVDFGTAEAVVDGVTQTCKYLTVSFPYSNAGYLQLFGGETAECLITGLQAIFHRIRGVPPRLVFDNGSGIGKKVAQEIRLTELFGRFQAHYGFRVTLCNPYAGHEKGHVENKVGYLRRHLLVPPPAFTDWASYNADLLARSEVDWARPHYKKGVPLATLFATDQQALRPLPRATFDPVRYETVRTDATGKFAWDGRHFYSSAPEYAQQSLTVRIGAYTVSPLAPDGTPLAVHRRQYGPHRTDTVDPRTSLTRLARNPGAWRNSGVREATPPALRTALDGYERDALRAVLQAWAHLHGQYGWDVAVQALTTAVERGRSVVADATVLAARLATWGPDRPADPGPDLRPYDALLHRAVEAPASW